MAAPTAPVPLREQFDNTQPVTIAVVTKPVIGVKFASASLVGGIAAGATTLQLQLADGWGTSANARPFPAWATAAGVYRIDSGAVQELLTVTAVSINNVTATLTVSPTAFAHATGVVVQIQESIGAAGTATYTFSSQTFNTANRGTILELCDLLDRAMREGSASVA